VAFSVFAASLLDWDQVIRTPRWGGLVKRAFVRLDLNHDGNLSLDDITELLKESEDGSNHLVEFADHREVASTMIRDFDTNFNGMISWDEFYDCLTQDNTVELLECFDKRQSSSLSLASGSLLFDSTSASIEDKVKGDCIDGVSLF